MYDGCRSSPPVVVQVLTKLQKELYLDVLVQVASVEVKKAEELDGFMKGFNENLNGIEGLTCRVWILKVVGLLVENGLVRCEDVGPLEQECMEVGNAYAEDVAANNQSRPVVASKLAS